MKISKAIETLTQIKEQFGDLDIVGGSMVDDHPPHGISVVDKEGYKIWPGKAKRGKRAEDVEGVYIE